MKASELEKQLKEEIETHGDFELIKGTFISKLKSIQGYQYENIQILQVKEINKKITGIIR